MKKLIIATFFGLIVCLNGCGVQTMEHNPPQYDNSMFVCVECGSWWRIVYHRETLVMYAVSAGSYNYGTFTMLCDADGKPLIWKGEKE